MRLIVLLMLSVLAGAGPARAAVEPVQVASFTGLPADSADRAVFVQAFQTACDADTLPCERQSAGTWKADGSRPNPFRRVDVTSGEGWQLALSVRFPPEVRVPVPRRRGSDAVPRARRSTLRTSRGFVVAVTAMRAEDASRGIVREPARFELYFPDMRRVVVPSARLPGGAYDFDYEDAGRVTARLALEVLLRATERLAADERAALAPAARTGDAPAGANLEVTR